MDLTPRQNQIIDVAMSLIAEKGIENLTIKNIAARTGISEAAVHQRLPGLSWYQRGVGSQSSVSLESSIQLLIRPAKGDEGSAL